MREHERFYSVAEVEKMRRAEADNLARGAGKRASGSVGSSLALPDADTVYARRASQANAWKVTTSPSAEAAPSAAKVRPAEEIYAARRVTHAREELSS